MKSEYLAATKDLLLLWIRRAIMTLSNAIVCVCPIFVFAAGTISEIIFMRGSCAWASKTLDIDTYWFLENTFTGRCTTISLPVLFLSRPKECLSNDCRYKNNWSVISKNKKLIRCSFCKSYGPNISSCQAGIKSADDKTIYEYQQHQHNHLPLHHGTRSTSTSPENNSLPLYRPRTPFYLIMLPMHILASISDDLIRVTAAILQCYHQDYTCQICWPRLWWLVHAHPSDLQSPPIFTSPSNINGRARIARSLQPIKAQKIRSSALMNIIVSNIFHMRMMRLIFTPYSQ